MSQPSERHLRIETRSYNQTLQLWQALGFQVREAKSANGSRSCQLYSEDVEVESATDGMANGHYHLKVKDIETLLERVETRHRDLKITQQNDAGQPRWLHLETPDGQIFRLEEQARSAPARATGRFIPLTPEA